MFWRHALSLQAGPSIPTQPSSVVPLVGLESQEVPFSAPEPPLESAQPAASAPEPTPQLDPVWEREEFRLQEELADVAEELLRSGLPETPERSLCEAELELIEGRMVDMRVQSERHITEVCL